MFNELRDFHRFVGEKVNNGGAALSPEEVLTEWRALHPDGPTDPELLDDTEEAVRDLENGASWIPLDEFDRDFRARHNLPLRS